MEKGFAVETPVSSIALSDNPEELFQPYQVSETLSIPRYLEQTYWWAYLHPNGVRFFERQWLVNLILWGNFARLRDAALDEVGSEVSGRTLQIACVYGDFTLKVADRLSKGAFLDVVDVAPVQLVNLSRKLKDRPNVRLHHQDSTRLNFKDEEFDNVILFFLLHEQPEEVRVKSVAEALRVVKPGGKVVFVDYHSPSAFNPFRYIMIPILSWLEPFALGLWKHEIADWVPVGLHIKALKKETFFSGLYQKVVIKR